ncbi:Phosphoglycolate phosphatase, HAD superfamily [Sinosporangium album]|uniref:Phosphoglycolate phosphatase, HAD superfamily n=1 Tax=Sinosporangium album TaxID=504805 RepID=A0A1G7VW62_9ACTN|nr:HAD hydrolase-like protein [Sinosporangium album]SDG63811.1 Phosphoglycolate phosphatase, HAD superfamily [Sinosporangium album]
MRVTHIVWDWNGTLFHDIDAVVEATNAIFASYGLDMLTVESFREVYTRPIWLTYERMLGRSLLDGEWERLDTGFHEHYHRMMARCGLSDGAETGLAAWTASGGSQSLLSMWSHDRLLPKVREMSLDRHFTRVDGLIGTPGGHKAEHMAAHIAVLGVEARDVLVIGDSVDDAHAARHIGARAVLYTGGTTHRSHLEALGVPVVDTLADALKHA